jgi:hypothetical protein
MALRNGLNKALSAVLLTSLLILVGSTAAKRQIPPAWGGAVNGLQMSIYPEHALHAESKSPKFRVELRNSGGQDLILNLGIMLANGKRQYPNAVVLNLKDETGNTRQLDLREPFTVASRLDPFVLPIPTGAAFCLSVDLDNYGAAKSKESDYKLKPGSYSIQAQLTGRSVSAQEANLDVKGIALMPYWMGTVTSNQLRFDISSEYLPHTIGPSQVNETRCGQAAP